MSELEQKVQKSIERLKAFQPDEGYYLAFSGGKDSVVCKALLDMAGCKYDAHYRVTSVDPPELVRFIKDNFPDVSREVPRYSETARNEKLRGKPINMWNLIENKAYPPTRVVRYCCAYLKESGGDGRLVVTGVRWAESPNRRKNQGSVTIMGKKASAEIQDENFKNTQRGGLVLVNDNEESRRVVEQCYRRHKTTVNPIIEWEDSDVWNFIRENKIPYCSLYDEGWTRLGCIGCPLTTTREREREFYRWPKYKKAYMNAFEKMLKENKRKGCEFKKQGAEGGEATANDIWNWWMEYDVLPGQMNWFDEETEDDE